MKDLYDIHWRQGCIQRWRRVGLMACLGALLLCGSPRANAATTCTQPLTQAAFEQNLRLALETIRNLRYSQAIAMLDQSLQQLECLTETASRKSLAELFFLRGLAVWYESQDQIRSREQFTLARAIDPGYRWQALSIRIPQDIVNSAWQEGDEIPPVRLLPGWQLRRDVRVDGESLNGAMRIESGTHLIQVVQDTGQVCSYTLQITNGSSEELRLALRFEPGVGSRAGCQELPLTSRRLPLRPWQLASTGTAVATLVTTWSIFNTWHSYQDLLALDATVLQDTPTYQEALGQHRLRLVRTWGLMGLSAAGAATSVWLFRQDQQPLHGGLLVTPTTVAVTLSGKF